MNTVAEAPTWDREAFERKSEWARTQPNDPSHQMKKRSNGHAPMCQLCGCNDGSYVSRKPCVPNVEWLAYKAEKAAERERSRIVRQRFWDALPADMQARVVKPR